MRPTDVCNDAVLETPRSGIAFLHARIPSRRVEQLERLAITIAPPEASIDWRLVVKVFPSSMEARCISLIAGSIC